MVMAGVDIVTVKEILGHQDIRTTLRYCHPTPENKKSAVEALASFFGEGERKEKELSSENAVACHLYQKP